MLPVSICAHVLAAVTFLIAPLAAGDDWPDPAPLRPLTVAMKTTSVPPAIAPPRAVRPSGISVIAPLTIEKERERPLEQTAPGPAGLALEGPTALGDFTGRSLGTAVAVAVPEPVVAPPPTRAAPIRAGQGVREPKKIVDVAPVYPEIARRARIEGIVILEAVINEHGGVERLKLLRSVQLLDAAAMDAVARWRYTPTLLNGLPVSVLMTITIHFTLQN